MGHPFNRFKVFSFWDTRQAWQSSSQRVGINFENVNFISNELLVEFDWSNSAKSSLDGLFERISKIGSDVIILDGANLLANLGKLFRIWFVKVSSIGRGYSMIMTFQLPPLARRQGLCNIVYVISIVYIKHKFRPISPCKNLLIL